MSRRTVRPDLRSGDLRGGRRGRRRRRSRRRHLITHDLDLGGDLELNLLIQVDLRRTNDLGGDGALDPTANSSVDGHRDSLSRGAGVLDDLLELLVHEDLVDLADLDRLAVALTARTGVRAAHHDLDFLTRLDVDEHEGLGPNSPGRLGDGTAGGQGRVVGVGLRLGVPLGLVVLAVELLGSGLRRDQLGVVVVQRRVVEDFGLGLARRHSADA